MAAIASYLGRETVGPDELRRNIVVRGINLLALKEKRFRIGGALLASSGECHPCSRMEAILGTSGYNAVRGHGGITVRILEGGEVGVGDAVEVLAMDAQTWARSPALPTPSPCRIAFCPYYT